MTIVAEIISVITAFLTGLFGGIASGMLELTEIFYNPTDGLTLFGVLGLLGLALTMVFLVIKWVRSLIN